MNLPRVTVVIPTFNRSELLRRAVESVLHQTLTDFELYISDNASTDDTARAIASFDDPRIRYAPLERNVGAKANFTRGLHLGLAPLVTLLQDDDLMHPENLERKVQLLEEHPDMVIAHSAFRYVDADDNVVKPWATWCRQREDTIESSDEYITHSIDTACRIDFSAAVLRRTAVTGEQFREADGPPCDMGLWLRVARHGTIGYLRDPLIDVRRHDDSRTISSGTYELGTTLYQPTVEGVARVQRVKHLFLDEFGADYPRGEHLRSRARRAGRQALRSVVRDRTANGGLAGLMTQLRAAARVEPTIIVDPRTLKLILKTLVSRGGNPASSNAASVREATNA